MKPVPALRLRCLLLSAGLHLLAGAWLLIGRSAPPELPPPAAVAHEITLLELPATTPRPAQPAAAPVPDTKRASSRAQAPRAAPRAALSPPPHNTIPAADPLLQPAHPDRAGAPRTPAATAGPAPLDLAMRPELHAPPPSSAPPSASPRRPPSGFAPPDDRALERQWNALFAGDLAQHNQQDGRVDPYLFALRRDAETLFSPSWEISDRDHAKLGTIGRSTKDFVRTLGRRYLEKLAQARRVDGPEDRLPTMLDQYQSMMQAAEDNAAGLSCDLCATLAWDLPPRISVRRSSGRSPFDELARASLDQALRVRPPSRELVVKEVCYRFEAIFFRMPPLPLAGCSFDENTLSVSCYYPTKKILKRSVKLLGVNIIPASADG